MRSNEIMDLESFCLNFCSTALQTALKRSKAACKAAILQDFDKESGKAVIF